MVQARRLAQCQGQSVVIAVTRTPQKSNLFVADPVRELHAQNLCVEIHQTIHIR